MSETFLLKNILSPKLVEVMARNIYSISPKFKIERFRDAILPDLETLELKQRAVLISKGLDVGLLGAYPNAIQILVSSMSIPIKDEDDLGRYSEFYFLPFAEYIAAFGLDYLEQSVDAMYALTKVFTSEFCIRPFIQNYPDEMMVKLHQWACDENHHVRRLVSEGTRPRLPWAGRLPAFQKNPQPVLELLELLKNDPELYVRRSVANNLNDIAKDNPETVISTLNRWNYKSSTNTQWIIKHASRSLIKDGHSEALALLGFDPKARLKVSDLSVDKTVVFGSKLSFSFKLKNTDSKNHKLVIDFVIHFKKANGNLAPKVFKLTERTLDSGEEISIQKSHAIKPISTRKYYSGLQKLSIQANGQVLAESMFELVGVNP